VQYNRHRALIERMYEDRATVSRMVESKDPVSRETKQAPQIVYEDQPCKLSQTGLARNGQTEAQNDVKFDAKLFIAPELDIRQGDVVAVSRGSTGRTETYVAGKPFPPYGSHQELNLTLEGYA